MFHVFQFQANFTRKKYCTSSADKVIFKSLVLRSYVYNMTLRLWAVLLRKKNNRRAKIWLFRSLFWKIKIVYMKVNIPTDFLICIRVPALNCIAFFYLTSMIKMVTNNDKDRLMPHLRQNMERQTRLKVLKHWNWRKMRLKCSIPSEKIYKVRITFK